MLTRNHLLLFKTDELIVFYLGLYNQEYGTKKGVEIASNIQFSNKIQKFITRLRIEKLSPGDDGFITMVNSLPYFFFSKAETLGYGSLFAIQLWIVESANDNFKLSNNAILNITIETIIRARNTKVNLSGNPTFFDKYFKLLEKVLQNKLDDVL